MKPEKKRTLLITHPGTRDRREVVFDRLYSLCPECDYSSVLYVTPAVFSQQEAVRRFFSFMRDMRGKNAYIPFRSRTLKTIGSEAYEIYGGREIVSDRIGFFILSEMLGEDYAGYARLLLDLYARIRHYMPESDIPRIKDEVRKLIFDENTAQRAVRAFEILMNYEKTLKEKGLIDFEGALVKSIHVIAQHTKSEIIVIDGFIDPTPLEFKIMCSLIEKAGRAFVFAEENSEFLKLLESSPMKFATENLKPACRRQFAGFSPYPSMEEEVEGIARLVKGRILEGVRPRDVTVSFPDISKYTAMLLRIFQKHGIQVSMSGYELSGTKPFVALQDMISSIEDDYPLHDFLSFLTSSHFPAIPAVLKDWAVSLSYQSGIVKGRQAWLSIKKILINSAVQEIPDSRKKMLNDFQHQMKKVISSLEKLREQESLITFSDELENLLHRFGFFDSLEDMMLFPGGSDMSGRIEGVFSELRRLAGFSSLERIDIRDAGFYFRQLLKGLRMSFQNPGGVRIAPLEIAAGLESEVLFMGGAVEGDLPSRPAIDPILPENVKKEIGLPFLEYYLGRQKRYFRKLLHSSREEPHFSYPEAEGDKIFLPSPFLDWDRKVLPVIPALSTGEEILRRAGSVQQRKFAETFWNGKLSSGRAVQKILSQRFGPSAFFSVTAIDAYRRCPLRFYLETFLGFERLVEPRFEVEARVWGKIAHRTMEQLFRGGDIPPVSMDKHLFRSLEKSLKDLSIGVFWTHVAREIFRKMLPSLKKQETDIRESGYSPYHVEKSIKAAAGTLHLKGKIDRIDRKKREKGEGGRTKDEIKDTVILLDYKTGNTDKDSLQLPLYAYMWQEKHNEQVERAGFYSLKSGTVEWTASKKGMEGKMDNALRDAMAIIQDIRKGVFAPSPIKEGICRSCYHNTLCKGTK